MGYLPGANSANFNSCADWNLQNGNVTTVGSNGGPSYYGTYDQSGNVDEWNDLDGTAGSVRGVRGGGWGDPSDGLSLSSSFGFSIVPQNEDDGIGFRLSSSLNPLELPYFVAVADTGNSNDSTGLGNVNYTYQIAQYPVTNCEYANFLNTVAKSDPYSLYSTNMGPFPRGGINRNGTDGSYTYTVKSGMDHKPVVYVSWFDAARYCNWLHNGRGNGSTESGAYTLNGATSGNAVAKNANASYSIPTENEWYKAAYYGYDNWKKISLGTTNQIWADMVYGDNLFVIISFNSNIILTSPDGINWTQRSLPVIARWRSIAYGNGVYVIVTDGAVDSLAAISSDGVNWTIVTLPISFIDDIVYGNGKFVIFCTPKYLDGSKNNVLISSNGIEWDSYPLSFTASVVDGSCVAAYGNNRFVAIYNDSYYARVITSFDGIIWAEGLMPSTSTPLGRPEEWRSIAYGNGIFVATAGGQTYTNNSHIATSTNGINWTFRDLEPVSYYTKVIYGNNTFMVFGNRGRTASSNNGINWTLRDSYTNPIVAAAGDGLFVAVEQSYARTTSNERKYNLYATQSDDVPECVIATAAGHGPVWVLAWNPNISEEDSTGYPYNGAYNCEFIEPILTPTPTITPTKSLTPTVTPTVSITKSVTPTTSITSSVTPTKTLAQTATPTISVTSSVTPTKTLTPTITPTMTLSPTITPTNGIRFHKPDLPDIININCIDSCLVKNFKAYGSNRAATLVWDLDPYCNNLVKNFRIEYKLVSAVNFTFFSNFSNTLRIANVSNLTNGLTYIFRLSTIRNDDSVSNSYCSVSLTDVCVNPVILPCDIPNQQ